MKCPTCSDSTLVMTERSGIEIDYCPTCRGVWLDRGELDKIIERAAAPMSAQPFPAPTPAGGAVPPPPRRWDDDDDDDRYRRPYDDDDRRRYDDDHRYGKKRKRGGLLGELFDF